VASGLAPELASGLVPLGQIFVDYTVLTVLVAEVVAVEVAAVEFVMAVAVVLKNHQVQQLKVLLLDINTL